MILFKKKLCFHVFLFMLNIKLIVSRVGFHYIKALKVFSIEICIGRFETVGTARYPVHQPKKWNLWSGLQMTMAGHSGIDNNNNNNNNNNDRLEMYLRLGPG